MVPSTLGIKALNCMYAHSDYHMFISYGDKDKHFLCCCLSAPLYLFFVVGFHLVVQRNINTICTFMLSSRRKVNRWHSNKFGIANEQATLTCITVAKNARPYVAFCCKSMYWTLYINCYSSIASCRTAIICDVSQPSRTS